MLACLLSVTVTQAGETPETLIVNGANSPTPIPFLCHLEITTSNAPGVVRIGSGSLITVNWVITAAQNVFGFDGWRIGLGATRIQNLQWFVALNPVIYPNYNPNSLLHNIALLRTAVLPSGE